MAHFYGTITGDGSMTSRCGTKKSGIKSLIQGESLGVMLEGSHDSKDCFEIYMTDGKKGIKKVFLGYVFSEGEKLIFNQYENYKNEIKKWL